tara:strand:- start:391 stop:567 length:177 start_codon:yes stop_codon:yes gene_type:complete
MAKLVRIEGSNKYRKVEMPWDLMRDIHNRVNAPYYDFNTDGKLGSWKNGGFKLIDILN